MIANKVNILVINVPLGSQLRLNVGLIVFHPITDTNPFSEHNHFTQLPCFQRQHPLEIQFLLTGSGQLAFI